MAGNPKAAKVREALAARAVRELGEGASALDYVCMSLEGGQLLNQLAAELETELGEAVSRTLLSHTVHRLADNARDRIAAARRVGASALVEEAVDLLDDASTASREELSKAKFRSDARLWVAERTDPSSFGTRSSLNVQMSLGTLAIDAFRQRALPEDGAALLPDAPALVENAPIAPRLLSAIAGASAAPTGTTQEMGR